LLSCARLYFDGGSPRPVNSSVRRLRLRDAMKVFVDDFSARQRSVAMSNGKKNDQGLRNKEVAAVALSGKFSWERVDGFAFDIAFSTDGTPYVVGIDGYVWRHNGKKWINTGMTVGRLDAISGGEGDSVYFVGNAGGVHSWSPTKGHVEYGIELNKERTLDLAIGPKGYPWVTYEGTDAFPFNTIRRHINGSWKSIRNGGARISGTYSRPWVTFGNGIGRWDGGKFVLVPGFAWDIGVGPNGHIWHIGREGSIYGWDGDGWGPVPGQGARIAVTPTGLPWVVNNKREIWKAVIK
jgi:hypothetical protein